MPEYFWPKQQSNCMKEYNFAFGLKELEKPCVPSAVIIKMNMCNTLHIRSFLLGETAFAFNEVGGEYQIQCKIALSGCMLIIFFIKSELAVRI